jgi:phosphatidate cytidylyltransferase
MEGYTGDQSQLPVQEIPAMVNVLRTRVISGAVVGIITIIPGILGGLWFTSVVLLVVLIATYEINLMMQASGFKPSLVFGLATTTLAFAIVRFPTTQPFLSAITSGLLLASIAMQMRHRDGQPIADWAIAIAGSAYLGWTSGHLAAVRELDNGLWWLVIAIGITWLADSGAFIVGKRFGKRKLAPSLSPKKTWEGYFGGVGVALLGGIIVGLVSPLGMANSIIAAILVGVFGTFGDLVESMFKRQAHTKDSGYFIPGHGGAFDRVDSLLWAGVIVFYYVTLLPH